uniref:Rho-GAP domain-containing protein n=1 Tax=Anopheles farauti TaxID=69004 RepID=A0A182QF15_9DIPT
MFTCDVLAAFPVPAPRRRTKVWVLDDGNQAGQYGESADVDNGAYQNVVIIRSAPSAPVKEVAAVTAAAVAATMREKETGSSNLPANISVRVVPVSVEKENVAPLKGMVRNDLTNNEQHASTGVTPPTPSEELQLPQGTPPEETRYKTSSPGDLLKVISTASRMLTESIGERVVYKTKQVAQNMRGSGWGSDSRKSTAGLLKTVSLHTDGKDATGDGSSAASSDMAARPHSLNSPSDVIQQIRFNSPMMNNGALVDAADDGEALHNTYDMPKPPVKVTNLLRSLETTSSNSNSNLPPSSHSDCNIHNSTTSLSSYEEGGMKASTFQRNSPGSQSLYSRILPKRERGERGGGASTLAAGRKLGGGDSSPKPLTRFSKNKSESNLYESVFYVGSPGGGGSLASNANEGLYGKLNIIPRPAVSSSTNSSSHSISQNSSMVVEHGSEEDNAAMGGEFPALRKRYTRPKPSPSKKNNNLAVAAAAAIAAAAASSTASSEAISARPQRIFSRRFSESEEQGQQQNERSDSWSFYDNLNDEIMAVEISSTGSVRSASTPEPVYENTAGESPIYGQLSEMQSSSLLQPTPAGEREELMLRHDYDEVSIADIIEEFDPLGESGSTDGGAVAAIVERRNQEGDEGAAAAAGVAGADNLVLIENLLGEESYSRMPKRISKIVVKSQQESVLEERKPAPKPPKRSDSLYMVMAAVPPRADSIYMAMGPQRAPPPKPSRQSRSRTVAEERTVNQIVHQNLSLPSGSVGNLVELDEHLIQPHLSRSGADEDDESASGGGAAAAAAATTTIDLSYPRPAQTNWYVEQDEYNKRVTVDPVNMLRTADASSAAASPSTAPVEKVCKSPFMATPPGGQNMPGQESRETYLPTYFEAIGGSDPLFERGPSAMGSNSSSPTATAKSPSVATKLLNALKRKPSFNRGLDQGSSSVLTTMEMVPRPRLTVRLISHKGHVLKFPSGKIGDVLSELSPRSVVLRERILQTYLDPQHTQPKETIHLRHILSVQSILHHKFAGEGRLDLHCFEVVLGVPKSTGGGAGAGGSSSAAAAAMMSTNPDQLITSRASGNIKLTRQSYMFGTHKRSDRNLWMAKILQSVTDVFGGDGEFTREFMRAGWCYVKKSVSAPWAGAWLLLVKRRLFLYSFTDNDDHHEHGVEELDLRKARCIGAVENDPDTISNLYVEGGGTSLFIDCPPYTTLYFVMGSPRETQIWHKVIRQAAHANGTTLHSQQLTRGDVPVLIDKCVNFIYAHGSMSEGIYRKSGSSLAITRILQLFAGDAFNVQLTRADFNEYDVASALKKFIRELPGCFFGGYAASFVAIGSLDASEGEHLKLDSYRQLLMRLPHIEYCTLKKLLGHLAFIASLQQHNRMGVPNLAMIWGSVLLENASQNTVVEDQGYHQQDADVVADLIRLYGKLFPVNAEEQYREQLMLSVLQKYHAAAENLSDAVKHSGDLKVWITIDSDSPPDEEGAGLLRLAGTAKRAGEAAGKEDKPQVNVDVTPTKTAADICKELAAKTKHPWYKLTLYEVIANDALIRPIHYSEKVLELVVRWTYWDEQDRKNNYLTLRQTTTLNDVYRTIQKAPVLTPTMELKFADRKTKSLRNYQLQLIGRGLVVLKKLDKKDRGYEEVLKIDLTQMTAYIGCEPKRDCSSLRWAITLVENNFKKRTRDAPFIGHVFGSFDYACLVLWYSSILYSQYKDDILPSGDLFF